MADIYVDFSAASSGSGTEASPLNALPATWASDNTYYLKRSTVGYITTAPTIQDRVVIDAYGTGQAPELKCRVGTNTDPIRINAGTLKLNNIVISGAPDFNRNLVVSGGSSLSTVILTNCVVKDALSGGAVGVASYNAVGNLELYRTLVYNTNGDNVNASARVLMDSCYLLSPGLDAGTANGDNLQFSFASAGTSSGSIIRNTVFDRRGSQLTNQKQCLINQDASAVGFLVENCNFYAPIPPEIVTMVFIAVPGAIFRGNYLSGGQVGINVDSSMQIAGNIFTGQIQSAIRLLDCTGSEVIDIINNTFLNQNTCITRPTTGSAVVNDTNNIYFGFVNNYLNSGGTLNTLTSFVGDPKLDSKFAPTVSGALKNGTAVTVRDFYNKPFATVPNRGAVETLSARTVGTRTIARRAPR